MRAGDIVFVRGHSTMSSIIRFFDKGQFSHVAIAVSDTRIIEAQYLTKVHVVPLNYTDYEIVDVGLTLYQRDKLVKLAMELVGTRYDYGRILGILLGDLLRCRIIIDAPRAEICSELVGMLLTEVGFTDKYLGDKKPNELYNALKQVL